MTLAIHPALSTHPEQQYLDLLRDLLTAPPRPDRTGTGTRSLFGRQMRFNLADGFPLLTTKRLPFRIIAGELLWMLSGSTNIRVLQDQGIHIWDEWADERGGLGPVYGAQWRSFYGRSSHEVDQIDTVLESLRTDPYGRRHIVSAWNGADVSWMALPPCHILFQFYVEADGRLSCHLYQRSADAFLGLPFNIASYALLTAMFAHVLDRPRGEFVWTGGDVHLYSNHEDQAREQIQRDPRPFPDLVTSGDHTDMDSWRIESVRVEGYEPHPHIAGEVAV